MRDSSKDRLRTMIGNLLFERDLHHLVPRNLVWFNVAADWAGWRRVICIILWFHLDPLKVSPQPLVSVDLMKQVDTSSVIPW